MPAYRRHFFSAGRPTIQASLRALRQPVVHVGSGLKLLDAFHHGIALASARQSGCFGLKPGSMLFQPLLE
jgi:hypothetical protein